MIQINGAVLFSWLIKSGAIRRGQMSQVPPIPENAFRIVLELAERQPRLDTLLLQAIREQERNEELKRISRTAYKQLFYDKRIVIKGQSATPSSSLAKGTTYVDILGYSG